MKKNPIAEGLKAENLSTNPASVHQVLGILQKSEMEDENQLKVFAPGKNVGGLYRSWKLWTKYQVVHSKTLSYLIGLGLVKKDLIPMPSPQDASKIEPRGGRIELTEIGKKLRNMLQNSSICQIDFQVVINAEFKTDEATKLEVEDVTKNPQDNEISDKLKKNTTLYLEVRDMFLKSPCYKVFEDFMYENCDSVMTKDELKEYYYKEFNQVYGKGKVGANKTASQKSEKSSQSTASDNNCVSIIQWCELFDVIKYDNNENVIFDLDVNELVKRRIVNTENGKKQIIFSGAPGTGKTHSLLNYVNGKDFELVQFHSSFDYTDFVEGIRPAPGTDGKNHFVKMDGLFKRFCRKIVNENLAQLYKKNTEWTLEGCFEILSKKTDDAKDIQNKKELIATINQLEKHYFIIDEINRADLSKVFGELLFALEDSYRGVEHRFPTQYQNLQTYKIEKDVMAPEVNDCFKYGFFIPRNLIILGSMNDIDKSVESVDFALRRRFDWCEIIANNVMKQSLISMGKATLEDLLESDAKKADSNIVNRIIHMNDVISSSENGLGREYHIGPAYFSLYESSENNLIEVFNYRIRPLIKEYLRGRDEDDINKTLSLCLSKLFGDTEFDEEDDEEDL